MPGQSNTEEWRPVVGYEGFYEVSDRGAVRSVARTIVVVGTKLRDHVRFHTEKALRGRRVRGGYIQLDLSRDGIARHRLVHHLVLEAFGYARSDGNHTRHLDGNPSNNHLSNLKWGAVPQ